MITNSLWVNIARMVSAEGEHANHLHTAATITTTTAAAAPFQLNVTSDSYANRFSGTHSPKKKAGLTILAD